VWLSKETRLRDGAEDPLKRGGGFNRSRIVEEEKDFRKKIRSKCNFSLNGGTPRIEKDTAGKGAGEKGESYYMVRWTFLNQGGGTQIWGFTTNFLRPAYVKTCRGTP